MTFLPSLHSYVVICLSLSFFFCSPNIALADNALADKGFAVVELFTSQGCSSCPPADTLLNEITQKAIRENQPIYTLSYHVSYWNKLGWTDPYSGKNATDRQYQYAKALSATSVYTPQAIVNGTYDVLGSDRRKLYKTIENVLTKKSSTNLVLKKLSKLPTGKLQIRYTVSGHIAGDELRLAVVAGMQSNFVPSGENAGRTLSHTNVVKEFVSTKLPATGMGSIDVSSKTSGMLIGLVQNPRTLKIKAAEKISL